MTLARLIEELTSIVEHTMTTDIVPTDVEVAVQGWDDNAYDGDKVEGIRLVSDHDCEANKFNATLFIIHGRGR
jgi:hypothetical protein